MPRSERCPFLDVNTILAGFTENLAWLQVDWLGSPACPHSIYLWTEGGWAVCCGSAHPGSTPSTSLRQGSAHEELPCDWCANGNEWEPGWWLETHTQALPLAAVLLCADVPTSLEPLSLGDDSLTWMDEGVRRWTIGFSGINMPGSRQSPVGTIITRAAICPHFQVTRLGLSCNECCCSQFELDNW